jgi:glycosyltransferase involved in cell wall biosynthesis
MADQMNKQFAISQPRLSIMVPAYGESPFLNETLISLTVNLDADFANIFVVDDASPTDHVKNICATYVDRITYIRNETNLGLAANFQNCINLSKTEYTMIMGSDDRVLPGIESSFTSALKKWPDTSILQLGVRVIDVAGNPVNGLTERVKNLISPNHKSEYSTNGLSLVKRLLVGDWFYFPAIIWQTEVLKSYALKSNYKTAVDLDLLLSIALDDERFTMCSESTFEYRRHSGSVSSLLSHNEQRVEEELSVHATFIIKAHELGFKQFDLFAKLAMTVRIHALKSGFALLLKNPQVALRIIKIAISPMSLKNEH